MKTSQSIVNLSKALLKAQNQMGAAKKDAKNPFFKSTYADLPTVMEVVKLPLNEAGIIVLQPASYHDGKNFISTTLVHAESGEWMQSETEVVSAKLNDPQAFGAAQTYARRFGLQAMLFIPAEDDDGNTAAGRTVTQQAKPVSVPVAVQSTTNPNAEFDAIPKPVTNTTSTAANKSSFRKTKPVSSVTNTQPSAPISQTSDEWS